MDWPLADRPAVLFLPGLGETSNLSSPARWPTTIGVIPIDFAGASRSPVADTISIESNANDAAGVSDDLGVRTAAVVGRSMGTPSPASWPPSSPHESQRLVLLGAIHESNDAAWKVARQRAAVLRGQGTASRGRRRGRPPNHRAAFGLSVNLHTRARRR